MCHKASCSSRHHALQGIMLYRRSRMFCTAVSHSLPSFPGQRPLGSPRASTWRKFLSATVLTGLWCYSVIHWGNRMLRSSLVKSSFAVYPVGIWCHSEDVFALLWSMQRLPSYLPWDIRKRTRAGCATDISLFDAKGVPILARLRSSSPNFALLMLMPVTLSPSLSLGSSSTSLKIRLFSSRSRYERCAI